jgi:hypothetical protein
MSIWRTEGKMIILSEIEVLVTQVTLGGEHPARNILEMHKFL